MYGQDILDFSFDFVMEITAYLETIIPFSS